MMNSRKSVAYVILSVAVCVGQGSLIAFLVFLLAGSPQLVDLGFRPNEVLWWDGGLCTAFFVQHSGMVRRSFRQRLAHFFPEEYTGALYAIASGTVLLLLIVLWQKSVSAFWAPRDVFRWLFCISFFLSFAGVIWSVKALRIFDPLGLRPILGGLRGEKPRPMLFRVSGPYRWVRHPLYLFMMVMIWSFQDLTMDRLLFNCLWTVWLIIGAILEERDLVFDFGDIYREYQRRVPMLIPRRFRPL